MRRDAARLLASAARPCPEAIRKEELDRLPAPMARYLRLAGVPGKKRTACSRLRQAGFFRTAPGKPWLPMAAEEYHVAEPPGFLWYGVVKAMPLVNIAAKDMFAGGRGRMLVKLAGLFTLADATGPEVDQGELLRYLGEIAWFPTAWLSPRLAWQELDERTCTVAISLGGQSASATIHFNRRGLPARLTAMRPREVKGKYPLDPWAGTVMRYREMDGLVIPTEAMATWRLASGDFHYFRGRIEHIEYDRPEPF
jgi:hypothetical protein